MILLVGALFLGARFFSASDRLVPVTIVYKLPEGATALESEARAPGKEPLLARFAATPFGGTRQLEQHTHLPPGPLDLTITLNGGAAEHRHVEIARDATVTVDLGR